MPEYTYYYNFQQAVVSVNLNELRHPETVRMGSRRLHCHLVNNFLFDTNFLTPLIIDTDVFNQYVLKVQPHDYTGVVESVVIVTDSDQNIVRVQKNLTKISILNANRY